MATSFPSRLLGLAFLDRRRAGPGILIPRCRSVHTFGMRFPLDLLFFGDGGRVVEERGAVPPNRIVHCARAIAVLELPSHEGRCCGGECRCRAA